MELDIRRGQPGALEQQEDHHRSQVVDNARRRQDAASVSAHLQPGRERLSAQPDGPHGHTRPRRAAPLRAQSRDHGRGDALEEEQVAEAHLRGEAQAARVHRRQGQDHRPDEDTRRTDCGRRVAVQRRVSHVHGARVRGGGRRARHQLRRGRHAHLLRLVRLADLHRPEHAHAAVQLVVAAAGLASPRSQRTRNAHHHHDHDGNSNSNISGQREPAATSVAQRAARRARLHVDDDLSRLYRRPAQHRQRLGRGRDLELPLRQGGLLRHEDQESGEQVARSVVQRAHELQ